MEEESNKEKKKINIAYIDAANLDKALKNTLGWTLDYASFRTWLSEKYDVEKAYIFIGLVPKYKNLYTYLQDCGFELAFKDVLYHKDKPKGNCDSDLLMKASQDLYEGNLKKAVIVASDGDYSPLIKVLIEKSSLKVILSPAYADKCSILLKRTGADISYIGDQRNILEEKDPQNEKAPDGDETP
ncbi:MAG: NYN domain-containing protein [Candidatus Paceibacterota bacterium]